MLDQLCRMVPREDISCFVAKDPLFKVGISPDLSWIPHRIINEPRGYSSAIGKLLPGTPGQCAGFIAELARNFFIDKTVIDQAVRFGKNYRVDCVWAVLQGKTTIISARKIAMKLGVPLIVMVLDDPSWVLDAVGLDKYSKKKVLAEFDKAIKHSIACGTASRAMADDYSKRYGVKTIVFWGSLDKKMAREPALSPNGNSQLSIGLAGQLYATDEWNAFLAALSSANWRISGRDVKVYLIGDLDYVDVPCGARIEKLGRMSLDETIKTLSGMDIVYCPYFFGENREVVAKTSFPSKLTAYFAAGRPVLFHGPKYASPAKFIEENNAGICCYSLESGQILEKLALLADDNELYAKLTKNGTKAFLKYLTLDNLKSALTSFLGAPFTHESN